MVKTRRIWPGGIDNDTAARVWLSLLFHPGDHSLGELVDDVGAVRALRSVCSNSLPPTLWRIRRHTRMAVCKEDVTRVLESAEAKGLHLLGPSSTDWPVPLNDLGPARPLLLYCWGNTSLLGTASSRVAIVGTRRASPAGIDAAGAVTDAMVSAGFTTVSGGARGIDAVVHRRTLSRLGQTIVVSASALERPYPPEHAQMWEEVSKTGLVISETPLGATIGAHTFLARNRMIAALALATIVVEAPVRSGALNTASHARLLGRELIALDCGPSAVHAAGFDRLVEEWGARVVTLR